MFNSHDVDYQLARRVRGSALCGYLLGLAAVRRGLSVSYQTYLGNSSKAFIKTAPDYNGGYLKVSDGKNHFFFDRSRGEKSFAVANNSVTFKSVAKRLFASKGISTPWGHEFSKTSAGAAKKQMKKSGYSKFVIKPVSGSLGSGVELELSAEEVVQKLEGSNTPWIVEQMIVGSEFRVFVVGDTPVASFERIAPYVVGDGKQTIEELIDRRNRKLMANPHSMNSTVDPLATMVYLAKNGYRLNDTPKYLEHVHLDARKFAPGRDIKDATNNVPNVVTAEAVKALRCTGLPNGGVDVLFDHERGCPYVLEVNPRAHIGGHSFPTIGDSQGLAVPDAILDHYFPRTKSNKRHGKFTLDFDAIQTALASSTIECISPIVPKDEWILRKLQLVSSTDAAERIVKMLQLVTIHVNWWRRRDGDNRIDAYFLKPGLEGFRKTVKSSKVAVVTAEVDRLICGKH